MHATCFGLYLDHPQARQYKHHTKEDTIIIYGVLFYGHYFIMLKYKIHNIKVQDPYNLKNVYIENFIRLCLRVLQ